MPETLVLLAIVLILAVAFDFINGFHDTANSIATVVATRVLTPRQAIIMAASLNFLGALSGTAVATTVGKGIVAPEAVTQTVIIAALGGAITWNLITWYLGIPSSSSHALIGGLVGGALALQGSSALNRSGLETIILSLVLSPFIGMAIGFILMICVYRLVFKQSSYAVNESLQAAATALIGLHVFQPRFQRRAEDHGYHDDGTVRRGPCQQLPGATWVMLLAAVAMAAGTSVGGWRIIKTMGHKIIKLEPIHGFAAETAAASVIQFATHFGLPVSTTHVISGSIMGVGASSRLSAVRWGVAGNMFMAWVLTIPACAAVAWLLYELFGVAGSFLAMVGV